MAKQTCPMIAAAAAALDHRLPILSYMFIDGLVALHEQPLCSGEHSGTPCHVPVPSEGT
jgi:hypothetical protein